MAVAMAIVMVLCLITTVVLGLNQAYRYATLFALFTVGAALATIVAYTNPPA